MMKENQSALVHPFEVIKAFFEITKEVIDFEPRPGSDKGYEPKVTIVSVLERARERVEFKKAK